MPYRNIFIANTAQLTAKNEQLVVENGETFSFPLEDIRCVLIEDFRTSISTALLSKFAEHGVTLLICNQKHLPTAMLCPINGYSRQLKQIRLQMLQTLPSKKNLWQQIVRKKIKNQAACLTILDKEGGEALQNLANSVNSGDPANVEGRAAARYFKLLFGKDFTRGAETPLNAALNYGYALVRGVICRTICLYGLEPCLGIHHCSELNNFNLADDLIEPFRPFIDLVVARTLFDYDEFGTQDKAMLLKSLNATVIINGKKHSVADAIEISVQSYCECLAKKGALLILPTVIDLEFKSNE